MLSTTTSLREFYKVHEEDEIQPLSPNGGIPKFVNFGPGDRGVGMPPVFFQDPKPKPGVKGQIHAWGIYPQNEENNAPEYYRDGSLYGPEGSGAIDSVHIAQVGYDCLPDDKYTLAHLFSKEGDQIGYLYDFGDKWRHDIVVEKIFPREQSYGRAEILEGKGMCPGENMGGSFQYSDFLSEYDSMSHHDNASARSSPHTSFGKPPSLFDPDTFDLAGANARLAEALATQNSVRSGAKKYHMPFAPMDQYKAMRARDLGKGEHVVHQHEGDYGGFWEETKTERKDRKSEAACAACGNPDAKALKVCSGCKQIMYCSPQHQKAHWKTVHKNQCSREFLK
ncbi:uncharacterized protein FIBRA_02283 [Fibroporia radiculosa]|uniref:MYND-type domain-containing protein n=1 Tax=Fibroporia radiculosa TaxID=599839 RepID=J4H1R9_9APHY|nr:uncharacterized protein FIBRA_02283 [Fibroporia radiculosa]CCM00254.1 predicted protein [Fibroporia radiculosa]